MKNRTLDVPATGPARRRATRVAVGLFVALAAVVITSGPAGAVPEGWSEPDKVEPLHALLVLGGIPLLIILVVGVLSMGPSLIRGDGGSSQPDDVWFGGPRRGVEAADAVDPAAIESREGGGARGGW